MLQRGGDGGADFGMVMAMQRRAPRADKVDELAIVRGGQRRAAGGFDEKGGAADGAEGADGGVDAARDELEGAGEELIGDGHENIGLTAKER